MLINYLDSTLVLLNIQETLLATAFSARAVIENNKRLLKTANIFNIPVLLSEQSPSSMGPTLNEIKELLPLENIFPKDEFSALQNPECMAKIADLGKKQIILTGLEAHISVLQTAFDFKKAGYEVFVVGDAISSAFEPDYEAAKARIIANNIDIVTTEMVMCEWLTKSGTQAFKDLRLDLLKRVV